MFEPTARHRSSNEDESNIRVLHEGVHNHEEDDGVIGHDKILNSMKEVIRQDPSVLIIERIANCLYIYSTQEMNLIGPLYDTLFLKEKCHSKWYSNSNDTHVYILQKIHTGIRTMQTYEHVLLTSKTSLIFESCMKVSIIMKRTTE
jgi:hypothetical protein